MTAPCRSCRTVRPLVELQPARRLDFSPIPGEFACRDREACFEAFCALPLESLGGAS